jgi:hypothetical protein
VHLSIRILNISWYICYREEANLGNKQIPWNYQELGLISVSISEQSYSLEIPGIYLIPHNFGQFVKLIP